MQLLNAAIFFTDAYYMYIPSVYVVFALILFEGLIGGAAYVNTFDHIRREVRATFDCQ
jgi:battenin